MEPFFLGNHPALDFLNTAFAPDGERIEVIGDGRAFLTWLIRAGFLDEATGARYLRRFGASALDATAAEARKLREQARAWLERWRESPARARVSELQFLNNALARDSSHPEIIDRDGGPGLAVRRRIESAGALLGPIANSIAELIVREEASRVKSCSGAGCTLWFLDKTKGRRRLFCSSSACGNRAKVAAFRERQRS